MPRWENLNEPDLAIFRTTIAFLDGRLEERVTINWALQLEVNDTAKRLALIRLVDSKEEQNISEPWRSAWRLIKESWNNSIGEDYDSSGLYDIKRRLHAGDRSASLAKAIVEIVAPCLKVEAFSELNLHFRRPLKRPKKVEDLFSTGLTSGPVIDPSTLDLGVLNDGHFLLFLASSLDAVVIGGLQLARQIGWDEKGRPWQFGQLYRVYYVSASERIEEENEPDEFHRGIAPSVKLLYAVISRLIDVDVSAAIGFASRWKLINSPIHLRLWAALARDARIMPVNEVAAFLLSLDDRKFWDIYDYPEITELRARRFGEFDSHEQEALTTKIRKGPPRNQWSRKISTHKVKAERLYCAVRELRRIEITGTSLPQRDKIWMDATINEFPDMVQMTRLDEGFLNVPKAHWISPNPDDRYNLLSGEGRLRALETALASASSGWVDDPAERASAWIQQPGNALRILTDLEFVHDGGAAFARVWGRFGWAHSPKKGQDEDAAQRDLQTESTRVLSLLIKLPEATLHGAIDGISHWLSAWDKQIVVLPQGLGVWLKLWPIAVEVANSERPAEQEVLPDLEETPSQDGEPADLDTLNTPIGKLVGVFLAACPPVQSGDQPFQEENSQRLMRNQIEGVLGTAGSIAKYRLIEQMPYFLAADEHWARKNLVSPLRDDTAEARRLWRAVAHQRLSFKVNKILGDTMADRAIDFRLSRDVRRSLVFRITVDCLYAFKDQRDPAISHIRIQQMIRSLDDEVRAEGAEAVQRFVRDVSAPRNEKRGPLSAEQLFKSAVAPFLKEVWPQERSLATPGVSRALADLPATAKEAFAEAVHVIERFLVPFACWSMIEYGLYGEEDGEPKLSSVDDHEKASALLKLLDLTIGTSEDSVVPDDLAEALEQIGKAASDLTERPEFRRLSTAARRG